MTKKLKQTAKKRKISLQATFNKVVRHLRKQGKKSMDDVQCLYRSPDGLKCAAGCLIPNKLYKPSFEGNVINDNNEVTRLINKLGYNSNLVRKLQYIHDQYDVLDWEWGFRETADEFKLKYKEPQTS